MKLFPNFTRHHLITHTYYMKRKMVIFFHGGHVGGQERTKHFSPPGTKLHFRVNSSITNLLFWPPTWPPCHVVANQKLIYMHYSVMDLRVWEETTHPSPKKLLPETNEF